MRRFFLSVFFAFPILTTVYFINAAFYFGDTGFKMDKTQNGFLVSRVKAPVSPVEPDDRLISIHGLSYNEFLGFAFSGKEVKKPGTMELLRDSKKIDTVIRTVPFNLFSLLERIWPRLMLMVVFLTLGSVALWRAPPSPQVTLFFLMLCGFATSLSMTVPSSLALLSPTVYSLSFLFHAVFNWVSFGLWLHFALRFPESRDVIRNRKWIPLLIYLIPAVTTVFGSLYMTGISQDFWSCLQRLRNLYLPLIIVGVFIKHALDYRKIQSQQEKNQIKFPLVAYWLAFSPYLFFHLLPNLIVDRPLIPFQIAVFGFFALPAAYFVGLLRHRLFNIDRIISRAISYFIVIIVLLAVYSLFLAGLKRWFFGDQILSKELFFTFLILVNLAFHPLILKLDYLIRKIFFRHEAISVKTMHEFSDRISATLDLPDLVRTITHDLPAAINITATALTILEKDRATMFPDDLEIGRTNWAKSRLATHLIDKSVSCLSFYQAVDDAPLKKEMTEIQKQGFSLVLPIRSSHSLSAILFVGHKKSGEFFIEKDIHLLASFANQAAIALENAKYLDAMRESRDQLEKMFHQKVQSEKMAAIGEMVSVLTHELKNPLGIIHSSAQYLLEGKQSKTVTKEMLYYIKNEVEHINQSIDSILKFARQKNPRFKKLDLLKQVGQLIEQWKQSEGHRPDVDIVMDTPGSLPCIWADPGQIRQVLLNLVQNSEEMLGGEGLVTIAIEQENEFVAIRVVDNGPGIPDNDLDKVFDKFFTTKKNGVGLGLAVCRQIVSAHNGTISLKNRFAGGIETAVRLPVKPLTTISEAGLQEEINGASSPFG